MATRRAPRRPAASAAAIASGLRPEAETAMTASAAPTQPGIPALRCPTTATGHRGPATVSSRAAGPTHRLGQAAGPAGRAPAGYDDGPRPALVGEPGQVDLGGQSGRLTHLGAG